MALQLLIRSGAEPNIAAHGVALLMTYFVHVALWTLATTWLARRRGLSSAARHVLWLMALLGPVLTVLCPSALTTQLESTQQVLGHTSYDLGSLRAVASVTNTPLWAAVAGLWLAAASLGAVRFAGSLAALWYSVRARSMVSDARLLARLSSLRDRSGLGPVRLSESQRVFGPLVLGRNEICIPSGMLACLSDAEVDGVFAHELAHLERGDGLWFPLVGFVQSVLWTHPLNHFVAARIRHSAELACDDRAVELTGDALGLARALTAIAASASLSRSSAVVPTMARSAKTLVQRVARLAHDGRPATPPHRQRSAFIAVVVLAAFGLVTAMLNIRVARALTQFQTQSAELTRAPDAAEVNRALEELLAREQQLESELAAALTVPGASQAGTQASVSVLELRQALNHVRAEQAWTEERFVAAWTKWQNR
jgi:beta-lactamase regulating signal transducer with metallopeptidase domain